MTFDYEAVNLITNQDFKSICMDLRSDCERLVQDYKAGELRKCCGDSRRVLEYVLHYLYKRITGTDSTRKMVGQILNDALFKVKLNNAEIITVATHVNDISKKYHHAGQQTNETAEQYAARIEYENTKELPVVTKSLLSDLSSFLSLSIDYINKNISGTRGKVTLTVTTVVNQRTMIPEKCLESDLSDVNDRSSYKYQWEVKDKGPLPIRGRIIRLTPNFVGATLIFKAINEKTGHVVTREYGPIKSDEVSQGAKTPLTGFIEVTYQETTVFGKKKRSLKANLVGSNATGPLYYIWTSVPDGKEVFKGYQKNEFILQIDKQQLVGKEITCVARSAERDGNWTGSVSTKRVFGPLAEEMFGIGRSQPQEPPVLTLSVEMYGARKVIYALAGGEHITKEDFSCQWTIQADGSAPITKPYRGPHLTMGGLSAGQKVSCMAVSDKYALPLRACITLTEDDVKAPKAAPSSVPTASPTPTETAGLGNTTVNDTEKGQRETTSATSVRNKKKPAKFEKPSYTMTPPKSIPKLFNSTHSLIHYYVFPNDKFILNSLEKVRPEHYLYRLLLHEGYEHVVFIEVENNENLVIVYDEASKAAFASKTAGNVSNAPATAPKAAPRGIMGRSAAQPQAASPSASNTKSDEPSFARCQLRMFSTAEEFIKLFTVDISNALEDDDAKTAIVMPLTIFDKNGYSCDAIYDTVRRLERGHMGKNILLLTMPRRDDLLHCYQQNQSALHPWTQDIQRVGSQEFNADRVNEAIRVLEKRIVLADRYEVDEIANLLFRKIIIEGNQILGGIDKTRIYTVAEQLKEHCLKEKEHYHNIPNNNMSERLITQLDKLLNDKDCATIIRELSEKVKPSRIGIADNLHPLYLERVYHMGISRYEGEGTLEEIQEQFDSFSGEEMQALIAEIRGFVAFFLSEKLRIERRRDAGEHVDDDEMPFMNMVFLGSPGTGKTSIAKLTARYLKAKNVLRRGSYVYTTASQNIHGVVGATAANIRQKAEEAVGGVLFIDEFQGFNEGHSAGNIAENVMREIVSIVNNHRSDLCIIVAGYKDGVEKVLKFDNGANRRFPIKVNFKNYSVETLLQIFHSLVRQRGETVEDGVDDLLTPIIESRITEDGETFGNAGYIKDTLLPALGRSKSKRDISSAIYTAEDVKNAFPNAEAGDMTEAEILEEFNKYIGDEIKEIKESVIGAADYFLYEREIVERRRNRGEKVDDDALPFMNMVFVGSPGTGKTSIAKLTAKYFKARGVMPTSRYVYRSASQMIQGVVGGTAEKIREAAEEARGGILFIDEFQGFNEGHSAGNIAENVMREIVSITNVNKGKLCIILAGYKDGVNKVLEYDEGAERRFPRRVVFKNYSIPTLMQILDNILKDRDEELEHDAIPLVKRVIAHDMKELKDRFGNGGYIRDTLLGKLTEVRLQRDRDDRVYRVEDVKRAFRDKLSDEQKPAFQKLPKQRFETIEPPYAKLENEIFTSRSLNTLVEPAVLYIKTDKGTGTGFLISKDGYALTCNHVIAGAAEIEARVRIPSEGRESTHKCKLVFAHTTVDMAMLKLDGVSALPYLPLAAEDRKLEKGEGFILVGYPFGKRTELDTTLYPGTIASFQKDRFDWDVVTISGEAKAGNSGSPLVALSDGKVIGVLLGSWDEHSSPSKTEEINYMRPLACFWREIVK